MKFFIIVLLLIIFAVPVYPDSVRFTRVIGGPPLQGVSESNIDMGIVQGEQFKKIKKQIQIVVNALVANQRWMAKEAAWWDVGPDAGYISAVVEMDGKSYTINSWYPLERQSRRIAVSETMGLVSVKSMAEKQDVESRNSVAYKQIVSVFDYIPRRPQK